MIKKSLLGTRTKCILSIEMNDVAATLVTDTQEKYRYPSAYVHQGLIGLHKCIHVLSTVLTGLSDIVENTEIYISVSHFTVMS